MKTIFSSRKAQFLVRLSIFLIMAALIAAMAGCDGNGDGSSQNLEIWDWYDLNDVRNNLAGNYTLMNDLDSTTAGYEELASPTANGGKGWQPIGTYDELFAGTLEGQGYQIRDLFINRPEEMCVGLFDIVDEGGRIEDIGVVNADVTGYGGVGSLVGINRGTVSNSYSTASVDGHDCAGGLVGGNDGVMIDSYSRGSVSGSLSVGGLVGDNRGTVSNSYSTGSVTGDLGGVGGLVGLNNWEGTISNSYYKYDEALINGENIITIGALFSEDFDQWLANDKFLDVNERLSQENGYYVINNVSDFKQLLAFGQNDTLKFRLTNDLDLADEPHLYIPYLAGEFDGNGHKISNLSFNFDFVSHVGLFGFLDSGGKVIRVGVDNVNTTGASFVGGLVGTNWKGTVSDSYSSGSVTGSVTSSVIYYEEDVGGLVGANWRGTVSNSYSTGNVTGNRVVGGLVGSNSDFATVSNSYSTANVNGEELVGGLVGGNAGTVDCSYATGSVTGNYNVGGLVGYDGTVSFSFWDIETSGQATSDGGTGKNTTEMQNITTFSDTGWDIIAVANPGTRNPAYIWNIVNNVTYPFLSWQPV